MRPNAAPKAKTSTPRPPVRVRYDPPTLEEAIFAVQGFADDVEHQAELAAALMGVPVEEVRDLAAKMWVKAAAVKRAPEQEVTFTSNRQGTQRAVVVERRPSVTVERKGSFKFERGDGVTVERKPFRGLGAPGQPRTLIKLGGR
jgi:hypothetical protein